MDLISNNSNLRALVVEDEVAIAQLIEIHLTEWGFSVDVFHDAESAFLKLQANAFSYDLCILDWMLPGAQGIDLVKKIREFSSEIKVLMLTAKADSGSIVSGLESGADEYVTKPFDLQVLRARVRNLLKRPNGSQDSQQLLEPQSIVKNANDFSLDGLAMNFSKHLLNIHGVHVHLTLSEFKLLASLLKARGSVLTRAQLVDQVQGEDVSVTGRTIDTHVFALRRKLGDWSKHIETIRGVGYRILFSTEDRSEINESND